MNCLNPDHCYNHVQPAAIAGNAIPFIDNIEIIINKRSMHWRLFETVVFPTPNPKSFSFLSKAKQVLKLKLHGFMFHLFSYGNLES